MAKLTSILMLFFLASPLVLSSGSFAKGEFKKELKQVTDEAESTAVIAVKAALYIGTALTFILLVFPPSRRFGVALGLGVALSLTGLVLFTEIFDSPMHELDNKKKMSDFFKK